MFGVAVGGAGVWVYAPNHLTISIRAQVLRDIPGGVQHAPDMHPFTGHAVEQEVGMLAEYPRS